MSNFPMGPLGPCEVLWKEQADAVGELTSLGFNLNVTFESADDTAQVRTAQFGTGSYDEIYTGTSCVTTVQMTVSTLAQLTACCVNGSITNAGDELMFATVVGTSMRDYAGMLVLKRQTGTTASALPAQWLTVFRAAPRRNISMTFDADAQRIYEMVFVGFPVISSEVVSGNNTYAADDLFAVGYDPTA